MPLITEQWAKLVYPGVDDNVNRFEISTKGRLRNTKQGHIYKTNILSTGYSSVRVTLGSTQRKIHIIIHKAVAYTYLPNPSGFPEVNHRDGNKSNNEVTNLEWCDSHTNQQHKYDAGLFDKEKISGENNHASKLTWDDVRYIRENYKRGVRGCGIKSLAKKLGVSHSVVSRVVSNTGWVDSEYMVP